MRWRFVCFFYFGGVWCENKKKADYLGSCIMYLYFFLIIILYLRSIVQSTLLFFICLKDGGNVIFNLFQLIYLQRTIELRVFFLGRVFFPFVL